MSGVPYNVICVTRVSPDDCPAEHVMNISLGTGSAASGSPLSMAEFESIAKREGIDRFFTRGPANERRSVRLASCVCGAPTLAHAAGGNHPASSKDGLEIRCPDEPPLRQSDPQWATNALSASRITAPQTWGTSAEP